MGDNLNEPIKPKGKGKKALNKLNAINDKIDSIKDCLRNASNIFKKIIKNDGEFENIKDMQRQPLESNLNKTRSMIKNIPERIDFEFGNLNFHIDFIVVASTSDDPTDLKGSIIYGTAKTLCFTKCIFQANNNKKSNNNKDKNNSTNNENKECKNCERITRCDRLEDKPLLQFTVNRNGLIKAVGEINDEWWIKEKEDLLDLHLRAVDFIWGKALEWTNENLLP